MLFAPGETTKTVRIQLETSAAYDVAGALETFRLNLSNAVNATIATPTATITIVDDDVLGENVFSHGIGDDIYFVDAANDKIVENPDGGTDLVYAAVDYTLPSQVEQLTLRAGAVNGTGNEIDNLLTGNDAPNVLNGLAGNDTLDGLGGADTMAGGAGNDTYAVDHSGDVVTEGADEGTDLVRASISYTLGAHLENLTLTGTSPIDGTGNALANLITGNGASNRLNGGVGTDTLVGGGGDDTHVVDNAGDVVDESAGGGFDCWAPAP